MVPFPLVPVLSTLFIMRLDSCHSSSLVQRICSLPPPLPHSFNESNAILFRRDFILLFFFYDEIVANNNNNNNSRHQRPEPTNKSLWCVLYADCIDISLGSRTAKIERRNVRHSLHLAFDRLCVGRLLTVCVVCAL